MWGTSIRPSPLFSCFVPFNSFVEFLRGWFNFLRKFCPSNPSYLFLCTRLHRVLEIEIIEQKLSYIYINESV